MDMTTNFHFFLTSASIEVNIKVSMQENKNYSFYKHFTTGNQLALWRWQSELAARALHN